MTLLYGIHPVLEALRAPGGRIERVCIERGLQNPRLQEIVDLARKRKIPLSFEERSWLDRKAAGRRHQGALCHLGEVAAADVDGILEAAASPGLLLVLDGIEDPQNLGAILRSAEVAAADGVILPRWRSAGLSPATVKASAGAAAHVKVARAPNLARLLESLKERGYWTIGLDSAADKKLWQVDLTGPTALVLGSEGSGMRRLVKERCDLVVSVPVRGRIGSYNVSVAAGIALYECLRQRAGSRAGPPEP
ncbi:MAG: 23S rRNA (guanosine(2251)-2'-O)-methyltransferase RlmB [Acidobacteria bacterium]|nr:23S rRNA (guanosine(2251)-2'-O)-methyltransferase RlmB [Acidobacteriota bacterium]